MIINYERDPEKSLYFIGSIILQYLKQVKCDNIDVLYNKVKEDLKSELHIDLFYYSIDWLFLLSVIEIDGSTIKYDNKKTDCT